MHATALESATSATKPAAKQRTVPLDPQVADRLLDLLSSDDKFRALFMSNPREALLQVGFVNETDLASPFGCFWGISKLASKDAIAAAWSEILNMLTGGLSHTSPQLDVGNSRLHMLR